MVGMMTIRQWVGCLFLTFLETLQKEHGKQVFNLSTPGLITEPERVCDGTKGIFYLFSLKSDVVVFLSLSHDGLFATPWTAACQASMSYTISLSLFKLLSIELVMPSNHLILYHSLLFLPSIFPSIRVIQ